jgi:hypothetical protein
VLISEYLDTLALFCLIDTLNLRLVSVIDFVRVYVSCMYVCMYDREGKGHALYMQCAV